MSPRGIPTSSRMDREASPLQRHKNIIIFPEYTESTGRDGAKSPARVRKNSYDSSGSNQSYPLEEQSGSSLQYGAIASPRGSRKFLASDGGEWREASSEGEQEGWGKARSSRRTTGEGLTGPASATQSFYFKNPYATPSEEQTMHSPNSKATSSQEQGLYSPGRDGAISPRTWQFQLNDGGKWLETSPQEAQEEFTEPEQSSFHKKGWAGDRRQVGGGSVGPLDAAQLFYPEDIALLRTNLPKAISTSSEEEKLNSPESQATRSQEQGLHSPGQKEDVALSRSSCINGKSSAKIWEAASETIDTKLDQALAGYVSTLQLRSKNIITSTPPQEEEKSPPKT